MQPRQTKASPIRIIIQACQPIRAARTVMMTPSGIIKRLTSARYRSRLLIIFLMVLLLVVLANTMLTRIRGQRHVEDTRPQRQGTFPFTLQATFAGEVLPQFISQVLFSRIFIHLQLLLDPVPLKR